MVDSELVLLRTFYSDWERLHGLRKADPMGRKRMEQAAQDLVDSAYALRNYYKDLKEQNTPKECESAG